MSPKSQPRDPRVAPKEVILTRRKLAQQQRQLRVKDRSMKSITQLLKSPSRQQSPKKTKGSPKKSPKKRILQEPVKRGPKIERRPKEERVWLRPTPNFKMVAKTNKRKLCTPRREIDAPLLPLTAERPTSRGSLDLKQLVEEDSLDEEDLLEILTCPSPVWWEDPPDPRYSEKPIYTRSPMTQGEQTDDRTTNRNIFDKKTIKTSHKADPKFIKKQIKLESILGNIKNKKMEYDDDKIDLDGELLNDEMLKTLENMDIPMEPVANTNDIKIEEEQIKEIVPNNNSNEVKVKKEHKSNEVSNEIYTKLEETKKAEIKNVNALQVPKNLPPLQRNPMHTAATLENEIARTDTMKLLEKPDIVQGNSSNIHSVLDKHEIAKRNTENSFLEKNGKDLDTISDTNVKFIDNVEDKELDDTSQLILDKIKKFFQEKKAKQKEYITVYKIVDNEERQEVKNDEQNKINYFYKKCKNVRRRSDKDLNKSNNNKTLALPNSEVKYCFKCSSIFETKDCHYCAMSEKDSRVCECDKSQASRSDL